jgi:hypothetical protein
MAGRNYKHIGDDRKMAIEERKKKKRQRAFLDDEKK